MYNAEKTAELKQVLIDKGFPEPFCDEICKNICTDFTTKRMLGYLYRYPNPSIEELVEEMLAIISDRDRIVEKKKSEQAQAAYNEYLEKKYDINGNLGLKHHILALLLLGSAVVETRFNLSHIFLFNIASFLVPTKTFI